MNIRNYKKEEYQMIKSWWADNKEVAPTEGMLPEESTFILEANGIPWICLTVYLLNTKEFAWLDNLVANPGIGGDFRKQAVAKLVEHAENFAKKEGYKRTFCMAYKQPLAERYQEMGYNITCGGITTFIKEL